MKDIFLQGEGQNNIPKTSQVDFKKAWMSKEL